MIKKGAVLHTFTLLSVSILPAIGFVSGIGLIRLKTWARMLAFIFSTSSIILLGLSFTILIAFKGSLGSEEIISLAYLLALPFWLQYYFTRPHIESLFVSK